MTAKQKISKAKTMLLLSEPFFASVAMNLDYIEDATVKTACTNGKCIKYNPEFIEKLDLDEVKFLLAHEVMHVSQLHHVRMGKRDAKKWNMACDYAINWILEEQGFKMIEGALLDDNYKEMSSEQIYRLLPENPEGGEDDGDDPGGCGGVESPNSGNSDTEDGEDEEARVKEMVAQAMNNAQKAGNLPAHLKRILEKSIEPKINWKEQLARFLTEVTNDDYSMAKPNKRYVHTGFYLPSLENEIVGDIIMLVDTSGSINEKLLNEFAAEMQSVSSTFNKGFHVAYVDTEVHAPEFIEPDGDVDLHPEGGGGTCFRPGFEWIDEEGHQPKAVIYFTDGLCDTYPTTPDYPVLWAVYETPWTKFYTWDFNPPFGEVIKIENE